MIPSLGREHFWSRDQQWKHTYIHSLIPTEIVWNEGMLKAPSQYWMDNGSSIPRWSLIHLFHNNKPLKAEKVKKKFVSACKDQSVFKWWPTRKQYFWKMVIFANIQYYIYIDIVGGSEKVKKYADVIEGWFFINISKRLSIFLCIFGAITWHHTCTLLFIYFSFPAVIFLCSYSLPTNPLNEIYLNKSYYMAAMPPWYWL